MQLVTIFAPSAETTSATYDLGVKLRRDLLSAVPSDFDLPELGLDCFAVALPTPEKISLAASNPQGTPPTGVRFEFKCSAWPSDDGVSAARDQIARKFLHPDLTFVETARTKTDDAIVVVCDVMGGGPRH